MHTFIQCFQNAVTYFATAVRYMRKNAKIQKLADHSLEILPRYFSLKGRHDILLSDTKQNGVFCSGFHKHVTHITSGPSKISCISFITCMLPYSVFKML